MNPEKQILELESTAKSLRDQADILSNMATVIKWELSGGSGSSGSNPILSAHTVQSILNKRKANRVKRNALHVVQDTRKKYS